MERNNSIILKSIAFGGYRSFGAQIQRFERFAKINLLIGQNNSGKSNVLNFLHHVYPKLNNLHNLKIEQLDKHISSNALFKVGLSRSLRKDEDENYKEIEDEMSSLTKDNQWIIDNILKVFQKKALLDNTDDVWFDYLLTQRDELDGIEKWREAFNVIDNNTLSSIWHDLTKTRGGSREEHWFPGTLRKIAPQFSNVDTQMIPAIRRVGEKGSVPNDFSGIGIIERLAKIQNPDVYNQQDKEKFESINHFLQTVTANKNAKIEIPYERDTIVVHMDGKSLPLWSLGTGIHEVVILAAAATICDNTIICMEEPELHLHPLLQKKLIRYLSEATTNQYFISTHSAALMDTPGAEIYHIRLENGESIVERVSSDSHKSSICEDLGYHPSDLLQANCIIWVEGPSDRIYLNHWINAKNPEYIEGIHYSIMFYGGKLASHLSGKDTDEFDRTLDDFISLRRLCRRVAIVIDSDCHEKGAEINSTKKRLRDEIGNDHGYVWITEGRTIENYLPECQLNEAISKTVPSAELIGYFDCYGKVMSIKTKCGKETQAPKVEVARYIAKIFQPDYSILNLGTQIDQLLEFINISN